MTEKADLPKFPDLPWSSIEAGRFLPLRPEDLSSRADVEELIKQMFDDAEVAYYLYTKVGEPAPNAVAHAEKRGELQMSVVKRPFYLHKAGDGHSFSQIKEASPDGVEYQQITLKLTERKTRELTIAQHLQAAESKKPPEPVLELKPNVGGIGVNLRGLWQWIKGK